MRSEVQVRQWDREQPPEEAELQNRYDQEGLRPYRWSNAPGDVYAAHSHPYAKVIYVVQGSITFGLPEHGRQITMRPGNRLELPAQVVHDAVVGPEGVTENRLRFS